MGRHNNPTPLSIKMAVYQRDGGRCRYCGVITIIKSARTNNPNARTVDHVIPRSKGGRSNIINLVTACKACNERKLSHTLADVGMRLLPVPPPDQRLSPFNQKRADTVCVNCGLGSKRSHHPAPYHGGPRKCRKGDTYFLAKCHLDFLQAQGVQ